jgi:hypothetical protein
MTNLKETNELGNLMSAVKDIMMKNQNLYQQDLENRYGHYGQPEAISGEEAHDIVKDNEVETPDPIAEPESIDPETIIQGSSGVSDGQEETVEED